MVEVNEFPQGCKVVLVDTDPSGKLFCYKTVAHTYCPHFEYNEVVIPKEDWDKQQEHLKQQEREKKTMTPCEKLGYKVGDNFRVKEEPEDEDAFSVGSIVSLYQDDSDETPLFKLIEGVCPYDHADGEAGAYVNLSCLEKIGTHNIGAGDWTCHQGDGELFEKLKQACVNAGIPVESNLHPEWPLLLVYYDVMCEKLHCSIENCIDEDFKNYRTPEYFLTAANAQPPEQTERDKEIIAITEWIEKISVRDFTDPSCFAECMYENGFKMSCLEDK